MTIYKVKTGLVAFIIFCFVICNIEVYCASLPNKVQLKVPVVEQSISGMCGPACLSMIFKYYGDKKVKQINVAEKIIAKFPKEPRVIKSGLSNKKPIDISKYPGTGTRMMRIFLKDYSDVKNIKFKSLPKLKKEAQKKAVENLELVFKSVAEKNPVLVHQYWKDINSRGHYRIVTGYNLKKKEVYLNDPRTGSITQTIEEFLTELLKKVFYLPMLLCRLRAVLHAVVLFWLVNISGRPDLVQF